MERWQSTAYWPEGTISSDSSDVTTDFHRTEDGARVVCYMLESNGFGGDGKIFPIETEVVDLHAD